MPHHVLLELPIYRFRIRLPQGPKPDGWEESEPTEVVEPVWRDIDIAANQTLAELGAIIPPAFDFDEDHLWAFFLSGTAWDGSTRYDADEVGRAQGFALDCPASAVLIRDLPLPGKRGRKEFLFLYDFGDQWSFRVRLMGTSDRIAPGVDYPRVAQAQGKAPPQYLDMDEGDDEHDEEGNGADLGALLRSIAHDLERAMTFECTTLEGMGLRRGQIEYLLDPFLQLQRRLAEHAAQHEQEDSWEVLRVL